MNFLKQFIGTTLIAGVLFSACNKSPYPGFEQAESGLYYQFFTENADGVKPTEGDVITLKMFYKNSKDSILFDSKDMNNTSGTVEFPMGPSSFKGSFEDAIMMMASGDSAAFIINADSLYTKTFRFPEVPAYIEAGSMVTFYAKLVNVKPKEQAMQEQQRRMEEQQVLNELRKNEEPKAIANYITEKKISVAPTASGLYYMEITKGKGKKVNVGDKVQVHYTGMLLDGTVFDSSVGRGEPFEFEVGKGMVIRGWDEALAMMNVGGKASILLPSSIAYGENGAGNNIPPFSPLVFEVEVVGVK